MTAFFCDNCGKHIQRSMGVEALTPDHTVVWGLGNNTYHFCGRECRDLGVAELVKREHVSADSYELDWPRETFMQPCPCCRGLAHDPVERTRVPENLVSKMVVH